LTATHRNDLADSEKRRSNSSAALLRPVPGKRKPPGRSRDVKDTKDSSPSSIVSSKEATDISVEKAGDVAVSGQRNGLIEPEKVKSISVIPEPAKITAAKVEPVPSVASPLMYA
jgi:hypothetical protein